MDNLFFAVLPDPEAKARIARLQGEYALPGLPVAPDCLHVSLHWVGDERTPLATIEAAKKAAGAMDMPCFRIAFDRVQGFGGTGQVPLVLAGGDELVGLVMLRNLLNDRLKYPMKAGFSPHLTFLHSDRRISEVTISPVTWIVRELVLVRSLHGRGRHLHLGSWPLRKGAIG